MDIKSYSINDDSDIEDDIGDGLVAPLIKSETMVRRKEKTFFEIFFVTLPLFAGYACLFSLRRRVKLLFGITDADSDRAKIFTALVSLVYLGNLFFRMGHNLFFAYIEPRNRVFVSIAFMGLSMAIFTFLFVFYGVLQTDATGLPSLWFAGVAYFSGGVSIGSYEANMLSAISQLGKQTKAWAIYGMPLGVVTITVGLFAVQSAVSGTRNDHIVTASAHGLVFVGLLAAIFIFRARIHKLAGRMSGRRVSMREFFAQLREYRHWLPQIWANSLALALNMLFMSLFAPGVVLFLYQKPLPLHINNWMLSSDLLKAINNALLCIGDTAGRRIFYYRKPWNPFAFLIFGVIGVACACSNFAYVVPLGGFFIALCNGGVYSQSARKLDRTIDVRFNLVATSSWLLLGDCGSVIGSNLVNVGFENISKLPWFLSSAR